MQNDTQQFNRFLIYACGFLIALTKFVGGHPISLSDATVDIQQQKLTVEIRILFEDLVLYHSIEADTDFRYRANDLRQAAIKHQEFLVKDFHVRDGAGHRLEGNVKTLDVKQVPDDGVLQSELKTRWLTYYLDYPVDSMLTFVTISQTFGGPRAVLPALMDCMVLQDGVLLDVSQQLMAGHTFTTKVDWENPPQQPKNWQELRAKKLARFRERLGIASYSGLYSFIYINDHQVRHEILIPLLTLESWLEIDRRDADFLEIDEQKAAKDKISFLFREQNPVKIEGISVKPVLQRLNFFGLDINDFALNSQARRVSVYQARVGVILSYSTKGPPLTVEFTWKMFNKHATFLRSVVYVHDEDPAEHMFIADRPKFFWTRPISKKSVSEIVSVPDVDGNDLKGEHASHVLATLVKNIYRSFDYRDDSDVYDALAQSVDGSLLQKLYLQIKRSLLMAEQSGASCRVRQVILESCDPASMPGKPDRFLCRWRVTGTVEHWGHIHTRENEYEAFYRVGRRDGKWKITNLEVLNEKRVRFQTGLRGYDSN